MKTESDGAWILAEMGPQLLPTVGSEDRTGLPHTQRAPQGNPRGARSFDSDPDRSGQRVPTQSPPRRISTVSISM